MESQNTHSSKWPLVIVATTIIISFIGLLGVGYWFISSWFEPDEPANIQYDWDNSPDITKFSSENEFLGYLEAADEMYSQTRSFNDFGLGSVEPTEIAFEESLGDGSKTASPQTAGLDEVDRYSETNVQVSGIDEPDIVKTDGENLYISSIDNQYFAQEIRCFGVGCGFDSEYSEQKTSLISALPVESMGIKSEIENGGELLLDGSVLIVLGKETIEAFDVKDSEDPETVWSYNFDKESYLETSRLMDGHLYLVLRSYIDRDEPCPLPMLEGANGDVEISCDSIYHPSIPVPTDSTYTVIKIDSKNGDVLSEVTFTGSGSRTVVYMSSDHLYITYSYDEKSYEDTQTAILEIGRDVFPADVSSKIEAIDSQDISDRAKHTELEVVMQNYFNDLSKNEIDDVQTKLNANAEDYIETKSREMTSTGIVQFDLNNLEISNNKKVPGYPLNQFSLDEYQGNLRIATTIEPNLYLYGISVDNRAYSVNDVYVLNEDLEKIGEITDLGKEERIYAVRYIGEQGYLVTFRETDPFYILDLADPSDPRMTGELKIPGYSAYLHPINESTILGVGREEGRVKLSLFDVSDSSDPTEIDKFTINNFWTEVEGNHHAFLMDPKHEIFFLPAGNEGHVFSYKGNKMTKVQTIDDMSAKRALYINDNLYVIGNYQVRVFDENNWEVLNEIEYKDKTNGPGAGSEGFIPMEKPIEIDE